MNILDDGQYLKKIDRYGMRGILENTPSMFEEGLEEALSIEIPAPDASSHREVVVAGLGGSAISGDILADWLAASTPLPLIVNRSYRLPGYAGERTLFLAISHSGNTVETLAQTREAVRRGCMVYAITSGGRLEALCNEEGIPILKVKGGIQPRLALPYLFSAATSLLHRGGLIPSLGEVRKAFKRLKSLGRRLTVETPLEENEAKRLASSLAGGLPRIYALERVSCAARRFKDELNENAKVEAKFDLLPEACHNEIEGFSSNIKESSSGLHVVFIRDGMEDEWEKNLIEAFREAVKGGGVEGVDTLFGEGETILENLLSAIYLGDYASYYLAMIRGVDPTTISSIKSFKENLSRRGFSPALRSSPS